MYAGSAADDVLDVPCVPSSVGETTIRPRVLVIFAGVKGYIDKVDVASVTAYEKAWLAHVKGSHPDVFTSLKANKMSIDDALDKKLHTICEEFTSSYAA